MTTNLLSLFNTNGGMSWKRNYGPKTSLILPIENNDSGQTTQYTKRVFLKKM